MAVFAGRGHHVAVVESSLMAVVEAAFTGTARGVSAWPDPHAGGVPLDEEYSRVSDPHKWRIIGARADAWANVLVDAGMAAIEHDAVVNWRTEPHMVISRVDRLVPVAAGALPIVVARSRIESVDDAGVTIGVGDPAVYLGSLPHCGCDACDDGSAQELSELDKWIDGIVSGTFRRLTRDDQVITVFDHSGWSASGISRRFDVEKTLNNPTGWDEVAGSPWGPS
jgi:hypothetical protein